MTRKKKVLISLLVIFAFFAGVFLFMGLYVIDEPKKYNELNTVESQATISRVETDSKQCSIYTNEYSCALRVKLNEIIDNNYLEELNNGVTITFRLPEFYADLLESEKIKGLDIASLRTDNSIIVSLESHNKMLVQEKYKLKNVALGFSGLFLSVSVICSVFLIIFSIKKPNK